VVDNYVMTCHDPTARDWLRHMPRSGCGEMVVNYVMTCRHLMARDWLRHMLRLDGLDFLLRPDDPLWNGHERHLLNQRSTWLDNEGLERQLRDRRLGVGNLNAGHKRKG
jgi:hypothetical protein